VPSETEKVLDSAEIADALIDLPGWELKGKQIVRLYTFKTFADAMEFANQVAAVADKLNHHPDIHISYTKVKILSWTHKYNAITGLDTKLAAEVERVFEGG
jgi:4a-hydroxytetrahydrobiopterin dehydratase